MNDHILKLQTALGITADGKRGPVTTAAILEAADAGRLSVSPRLPQNAGASALPAIPWVEELRKVLGLHEVRDRAKLSKWLRSDGKTLGDPSKLPWCGDAVDTALALALPDEPRPGALGENPYWARNWALLGVPCQPAYGCIGVFVRDGGGHVGFLVGENATRYQVLGGNQGNTVSVVSIEKSRCIATRWPSTSKHPRAALPAVGGAPLSTNEA